MAENREVNLLGLLYILWHNKKTIVLVTIVGVIIGVIIAISTPKEYTTTIVLMPESQQSSGGTMSSLAALAGINISSGAGGDALVSPDLYPSVFRSTPFVKGLFDIEVKDTELDIDTTLYAYLNNYQEYAWWSYILNTPSLISRMILPSKSESISGASYNNKNIISKKDMDIIESLRSRISVYSDKKTGMTTIEVTMQSPEISARVADTVTSYFQRYIIDYRTQKARNDLEYAEKLYVDAKNNYYKVQQKLATFSDANRNVVSAKYKLSQDRLQNEANLAYSVYNQTAQQLQLAKVKVQDNTPVFKVIQPAVQPIDPSKPSKKMIVISFFLLSFIGSSMWILRKDLRSLLIKI